LSAELEACRAPSGAVVALSTTSDARCDCPRVTCWEDLRRGRERGAGGCQNAAVILLTRVTKGDEEQRGKERQSAQCRCAGAERPYPVPPMPCKLDLVEAERAVKAPPSPRAPVGANPVMGDDDVPANFLRSSVHALQRPGTGSPKPGHLPECRAIIIEGAHLGGWFRAPHRDSLVNSRGHGANTFS
jgi:hypothetical protein